MDASGEKRTRGALYRDLLRSSTLAVCFRTFKSRITIDITRIPFEKLRNGTYGQDYRQGLVTVTITQVVRVYDQFWR